MKPPTPRERLQSLLGRLEFDRAVFFGLIAKVWGVVSGPVSALLIIKCFTPTLQGYYYTFGNLLALQVFAELGLGTVIVQFASHEWSKLGLDARGDIVGDQAALSRLGSLARFSLKWYLAGGGIVAAGLGLGGYIFFTRTPEPSIDWTAPWLILCLFTGGSICLVPIWSLLEGCNQVTRLYFFRFLQGIGTNVVTWLAILAEAKLWTASIACAVSFVASTAFIYWYYRRFMLWLFRPVVAGPVITWRSEILPMQWKVALSWMSGYFVFSLFTPVLFHYQGATVAGQFGMSWNFIGITGAVAGSWLSPRVPQFGILIAKQEYQTLDDLFWRVTKVIVLLTLVLAAGFIGVVGALNYAGVGFIRRLLPPLPFSLFLLAQVVTTVSLPFSAYLRAHKQEPLLWISLLSGVLVAASTLFFGKYSTVTGMAVGYLAVQAVVVPGVVLIWQRCRKAWHLPAAREVN